MSDDEREGGEEKDKKKKLKKKKVSTVCVCSDLKRKLLNKMLLKNSFFKMTTVFIGHFYHSVLTFFSYIISTGFWLMYR